jgi:DNA replication factor GINS
MGQEFDLSITYETLFDILRREKNHDELQKLSNDFYKDVVHYLREKKKIETEQSTTAHPFNEASLAIMNINKMLRDLYDRREKKIISMAIDKARTGMAVTTDALLAEELQLFERLSELVSTYRIGILQRVVQTEYPEVIHKDQPRVEKKFVTVRFIISVPKFIGRNLESYGPFQPEDIASLPFDIAKILTDNGKAEEISSGDKNKAF